MPQTTKKNHLPQWMADTPNPTPVTHRASEAATREGLDWANFRAADGRLWVYRGRMRQGVAALIDARRSGTGVLPSEMPGNFADIMRKLSKDGISIGKVEWTTEDGATIIGRRKVSAYVLLDEVAQEGRLYACDAQAQASMNLRDGNKASGKPVSSKGAAWPYVQSGLICDSLELIPLNGNKSTVAQSLRDGRAIRNARADAKRGHKRLNRELDLRDGGQARPAPKGRDRGAAA